MAKVSESADLSGYAPVAARIGAFYERYPDGRIITQLRERTAEVVIFRALVYRHQDDSRPAATGWASERPGDGDINEVACLENTETSAVGRALANVGLTASLRRPSVEEMQKVSRARTRIARERELSSRPEPAPAARPRPSLVRTPSPRPMPAPPPSDAIDARGQLVADLLRLVQRAAHAGARGERVRRWRAKLLANAYPDAELIRCEQRLRRWIAERVRTATG